MEKTNKSIQLTKVEADYVDISPFTNDANCSNCRWFSPPYEDSQTKLGWCSIVEGAINPNGISAYYMPIPVIDQPLEASTDEYVMELAQGSTPKRSPVQRITSALGLNAVEKSLKESGSSFKAIGAGRWIAAYTNNFMDRDKEILSEAAHRRYIGRVKAGLVPYPELWEWHVPGTRHGQADHIDMYGHMVIAIGHYDDTPMGKAAEAWDLKHGRKLALSHGFKFPAWAFKDGVYADYNTFEITKLLRGKESNRYTNFEVIEGMVMTPEQKEYLLSKYGADVLKEIESTEQAGKALADIGAKYKDFADTTAPPDASTAKAAQDTAADTLLFDLMVGHGETIKALGAVEKGVSTQVKTIEDTVSSALKEMRGATDALNAAAKDMRDWLALKPKAVDADRSNIVSETDAAKAKESMVVEYDDSAFPGMKAPLHPAGKRN